MAPVVRVTDPALQHHVPGTHLLADGLQTEFIETAECGQVRSIEGSVRQVEVFRKDSVGTSIIERPRLLSGDRRANASYTLDSDEPVKSRRPRM